MKQVLSFLSSAPSAVRSYSHLTVILLLISAFAISACDFAKNAAKPDRGLNSEFQDYRDGLAPRDPEPVASDASASGASIPSLQPYISGATQNLKPTPLVSISVNQSIPLKDVLFELAQQAQYDLELDPRIRGSIIYTVRNKPFDLVIERIADIAGLRYKFDNDILRVELDVPYSEVYKIDYLNVVRSNTGAIRNNISVVTGDGADTGSDFEAAITSEADFWAELEAGLEQILTTSEPNRLTTQRDPVITAVDQNPDIVPVAPQVDANGNVIVQPPQATLQVESLPIGNGADEPSLFNRFEANDEENPFRPTSSVSRNSGVINVYASEKTHKSVANYLNELRRSATAQVLIEAKILEVTLNDEFATGIDWSASGLLSGEVGFTSTSSGLLQGFDLLNDATPALPGTNFVNQGSNFVLGTTGNSVQAVVQAISAFGSTRALASPRLTVLNNQSAVLNVATNRVFFEVDIETNVVEGGGAETDVSSEIRTVPEGIVVNVQPAIDLQNGTVSMSLRPTITRVVNAISDPAVEFAAAEAGAAAADIVSLIPELSVQEIDSIIKMRSGQPIVLGGLLNDVTASQQEGVPGLSELPLLGTLFRNASNTTTKSEIVIILKATIINAEGNVHNTDKDIYRQFANDRRPFNL